MLKRWESTYPLTGETNDWVKFKKEKDIDARIVRKIRNKGGAFNYLCVIWDENKKEIPIGMTYNTKEDLPVGSIIRVSMGNLNKYRDPKTGELWYNWVFPRFIEHREDKSHPDSVVLADSINSATNGEVGDKSYPPRFAALLEKGEIFQKAAHPKNWAVIQAHFRGKSVHFDFRRKVNGYLEGDSLLVEPPDIVKESVKSVQEGQEVVTSHWNEWKFRPGMDPNEKCASETKARQPLEWLDVAPGVHEPGEVGATKEYPGVFVKVDEGMAYPGVQKSYFREYFLDMKKFKGKAVFRIVGFEEDAEGKPAPTKRLQWLAWMAKDDVESQIPYILTKRARKKEDYLPRDGESALPPWWENKIPPSMRWWISDLSPNEKKLRMKLAYNNLVERNEIPGTLIEIKKKMARFTLRLLWWKGQEVVRDIPNRRWEILLDLGEGNPLRWTFDSDPTTGTPVPGTKTVLSKKTPDGKPSHSWLDWKGILPPSDSENPTKKLPINVEILDTGNVKIYENSDMFFSASFEGESLKGFQIMRREDPTSDLWIFQSSELPIEKSAEITFLYKESPRRFVLGPVLLPEIADSQSDIISSDVIEEAAHRFMREKGRIGLYHKEFTHFLDVVESYILRAELTLGKETLPKGTWMLGVIVDPETWKLVESGELTGFSLGGWGAVGKEN
jgi:hypothetical protein